MLWCGVMGMIHWHCIRCVNEGYRVESNWQGQEIGYKIAIAQQSIPNCHSSSIEEKEALMCGVQLSAGSDVAALGTLGTASFKCLGEIIGPKFKVKTRSVIERPRN